MGGSGSRLPRDLLGEYQVVLRAPLGAGRQRGSPPWNSAGGWSFPTCPPAPRPLLLRGSVWSKALSGGACV